MGCPGCGSEEFRWRRRFVNLLHSQCRHCGLEYNSELTVHRSNDEIEEVFLDRLASEGYEPEEAIPEVEALMTKHGDALRYLDPEDWSRFLDMFLDSVEADSESQLVDIVGNIVGPYAYG